MTSILTRTLIAGFAFAVAGVVGAGGSARAQCLNVDISVTNEHPSGDPIKVLYVRYARLAFDYGAGAWVTNWYKEGLDDKVPNQNATVTWHNQDLQGMWDLATSWRVYFKRQLTGGVFPTYGDTLYQEFDRTGHACDSDADDSYTFVVNQSGTPGE